MHVRLSGIGLGTVRNRPSIGDRRWGVGLMLEPVPVTPTRVYEPGVVEREWQRRWREAGVFSTPEADACETDVYIFAACPFTSGNAHMGHVRSYTITDAYARFRRACGDGVLFSLGF